MVDDARKLEEQTTQRRAGVLGLNYFDTSANEKKLYKDILSVAELYRLKVVPLAADEYHIHFGLTTTTAQQIIKQLTARFSDQKLRFSVISETGFKDYMKLYDPPKKVEYQDIAIAGDAHAQIIESVSATLDKVRPDDMLAYLAKQAYQLKASDIHLECQRENVRVRFRVDGVLHPVAQISYEKYRHLVSVVASAANISTDEKEAQTGHISKAYKLATGEEVTLNLRVEAVPTVYGLDIVARLFNIRLEFFQLQNLRLT